MAGRSTSSMTKHAYRLFNPGTGPTEPNRPVQDEFNETDIWGSPGQLPPANQNWSIPTGRYSCKIPDQTSVQTGPCSLPVNIPDWSKILGEAHQGHSTFVDKYKFWDDEVDRAGSLIPPHEFLSMNRTIPASSVQEGIGRTLKGRDLRRVRDAVWERTGFQA
jgi:Senescence regulator